MQYNVNNITHASDYHFLNTAKLAKVKRKAETEVIPAESKFKHVSFHKFWKTDKWDRKGL